MFDLATILTPECTLADVAASSKKRLLEFASEVIADHFVSLEAHRLFDELIARERLGSTALGHGVAIPHCRIDGLSVTVGALFRLAEPIDFDAPDDQPVDLVFVLVVPREARDDHLAILSNLARGFSDAERRRALREADGSWELFQTALSAFAPADTGT